MDVVQLDNEKFFHIHGLKDARPLDFRIGVDDTAWPCKRAQEIYDQYDKIIK